MKVGLFSRQMLGALTLGLALSLTGAPAPARADLDEDIRALQRASKARAAIVRRISPAVVHISVEKTVKSEGGRRQLPDLFNDEYFRRFFQPRLPREYKQRGLGSGTIVDPNGYILTNNHVVGDADKITVKLPDGREFPATITGTDPATDLAVIKIEGKNLPSAKLGNSETLEVGESVIAVGNPYGLEQTITAGIVSAKGRSSVGLTDYEDFIQTDASINPGNSGGPLVNLKGEVVGINTAIFSRSGGSQGIGFAIPISMAREIMTSLIETGKVTRGFLGVVIQDVTEDLAAAMGLKSKGGVLISNVGGDTPAGKGGIKQGDVVIAFNEKAVGTSNELRNAVAAVKPGTTVPVKLIREGKEKQVSVLIEAQPSDMRAAISGTARPGGKGRGGESDAPEKALGVKLQPLTGELAEQLGYQGLSGVVVVEVASGSPAEEAKLRPRSLIREVNQNPIHDIPGFRRAYGAVPSGKHLLLLVQFGNFTRFVALKKP